MAEQSWRALAAVCLGILATAFTATAVTVALPAIGADLRLSETDLERMLTLYFSSFGGSLLLAGKLADTFGQRRVFVLGALMFSLASMGCGLTDTTIALYAFRAVQGISAGAISVTSLPLVAALYSDERRQARALGLCTFIAASGGSVGFVVGGTLLEVIPWRWIFLLSIPIGVIAALNAPTTGCVRQVQGKRAGARDVALVIPLFVSVVYFADGGDHEGVSVLAALAKTAGVTLFFAACMVASCVPNPRNLTANLVRGCGAVAINCVAALLATASITWSFVSSLYLQRVLEFTPLQAGLACLPATACTAIASLFLAPRLAARCGMRLPIVLGTLCTGAGLMCLGAMDSGAIWLQDVFPGMLLMGLGVGTAHTIITFVAIRGSSPQEVGTASGLINSSFMLGGALGFSAVRILAAEHTARILSEGAASKHALASGYEVAFVSAAAVACTAALVAALCIRDQRHFVQRGT